MQLLLPDVLTWLQDTRADVKLQAMQLLHDIVAHCPGHVQDALSQLAVRLTSCFDEENTELRWLSMELFAQLLAAPGRRQLLQQVEMNLLPLFFHMNEEIPRVAQAAQEALTRAAELLRWQQLQHLVSTADMWKIAECLVQKAGSAVQQYVQQSVRHLHSPQASMQEAAVRFLGLLGRQLRSENPQKVQDIRNALQSVKEDSEPAVRCLVLQTLLNLCVLEDVPPTRPRGAALCRWLHRMFME
ncbi:maestro heat-like repeat family member 5 [Cyrtonyx montezumae]|uniref:maestro heat-like repeat family member 5 n=1 Tax=Cyrtonyx montezumae TaxID=9017 RepID=UPI0032DB6273